MRIDNKDSLNNLPLVSVIVPVYNTERFLPKCIESVLAQTYSNLEIIAVDDGSKDKSLSILKEHAKKDDRLKVFSTPNRGVSATRNFALEKVNGEYVCFIDSDDYMAEDFVEILYRKLIDNDADIAVVKNLRVSEKQKYEFKRVADWKSLKVENYNRVQAMCQLFTGKKFGLGTWNKMYKTSLLRREKKSGFFEHVYYSEDTAFLFDTFYKAENVVYIPLARYAYTRRNGSLVRSKITDRKVTAQIATRYCSDECKKLLPTAYPYVTGWRVLSNFELFYYMFRDKYFDIEVYEEIRSVHKNQMKCLTRSKGFPLYRRALLPLASFLCNLLYRLRMAKEFKNYKKSK